jgi:hypothetical protein
MTLSLRYFDFHEEDCGRLFDLFERVWHSKALRERWNWEYLDNPKSDSIKILVAEDEGNIAGYTTRLPFELKVRGKSLPFYFSVNSMVDPNYGRRGIMKSLYLKAAETMPLLYSKGSTTAMYRLLMKIGYETVEPNNYMARINSLPGWILWRLGHPVGKTGNAPEAGSIDEEFNKVVRYGSEFDIFWNDICSRYPGIVVKNAKYMNWRYVDIPHKSYESFYRISGGKIVSTVVFYVGGKTGTIVDIMWDSTHAEEPGRTIRFIRRYARACGLVKTVCWATFDDLRRCLKKHLFFERKETPHFSALSKTESIGGYPVSDASAFHFVHGDGDTEYIS